MRIAVGCDHRGLQLKQSVKMLLVGAGYSYEDFGCYTTDSVDYPDTAQKIAKAVASGNFKIGILICNTGIGMSIAANKVKGIRAALCHNASNACQARQHNDANILCLGAEEAAERMSEIIGAFLTCEFEGGRHQHRLNKIRDIEN